MKSVTTPKGTILPLISLKGKDYLQVMHRLQWFNETTESFDIQTTIVKADKDESVVTSKVTIYNSEGKVVKSASATKREDSKGFGDHLEKAETGSIGRALALLGFGTQFAVADLDEGSRIVDSPAPSVSKTADAQKAHDLIQKFNNDNMVAKNAPVVTSQPTTVSSTPTTVPTPSFSAAPKPTFRKAAKPKAEATTAVGPQTAENIDDWLS